jgi:hypothetical protein
MPEAVLNGNILEARRKPLGPFGQPQQHIFVTRDASPRPHRASKLGKPNGTRQDAAAQTAHGIHPSGLPARDPLDSLSPRLAESPVSPRHPSRFLSVILRFDAVAEPKKSGDSADQVRSGLATRLLSRLSLPSDTGFSGCQGEPMIRHIRSRTASLPRPPVAASPPRYAGGTGRRMAKVWRHARSKPRTDEPSPPTAAEIPGHTVVPAARNVWQPIRTGATGLRPLPLGRTARESRTVPRTWPLLRTPGAWNSSPCWAVRAEPRTHSPAPRRRRLDRRHSGVQHALGGRPRRDRRPGTALALRGRRLLPG